jgi:hypothetical protein
MSSATGKKSKQVQKKDTPAETKPVEAKPVEAKPVEAKPVEAKPAEAKPAETKPAETKPAETKPAETKPVEATKKKGGKKVEKVEPVVPAVPVTPAEPVAETPATPADETVAKTEKPAKKPRAKSAPKADASGAKKPRAKKTDATKTKKAVKGGKKAKVAKKVVKKPKEEIKLSEETRTRYFKLLFGDSVVGRFSGNKPRQAASKALTSIIRKQIKAGEYVADKDITFSLKECTRWNKKKCNKGSTEKIYMYTGRRVPLSPEVKKKMEEKPVVHNKDDPVNKKIIVYNYCNKVHKFKPAAAATTAPAATK